jgi:GT2 family glycosyltransferase
VTVDAGRADAWPGRVTVVVPVRDGAAEIGEQLAALAAQDYAGEWEVVVADNGSTDSTGALVRLWMDRMPNLRLVDASARPGASHARNVGTRAGRGSLVLYADADDVVSQGWVSAMVQAAPHGELLVGQDYGAPSGASGSTDSRTAQGFLAWGRGGNLGVHRETFEAVGGWDEERLLGEDVEFCWRVQLAGYRLVRVPRARVRYRRPEGLLALARHQFGFGIRAPALYREFGAAGPHPVRALRRVCWIITRSPYLLFGRRLRRRWVLTTAAVAGRARGTAELWWQAAWAGAAVKSAKKSVQGPGAMLR